MINLWNLFGDTVQLRVTGADVVNTVTKITQSDISILSMEQKDSFTLTFFVKRSDLTNTVKIIHKRGDDCAVIKESRIHQILQRNNHRPLFLGSIVMLLFLSIWLPSRILFIKVEGNEVVPTNQIIEAAQRAGIQFGSSRKEIRSERFKNALLEAIPELQWLGVNTKGCVATISVREKGNVETNEQSHCVSSIVSTQDGVIVSLTVQQGTPLCQVGQGVTAGQTLVSGYTDCGKSILACSAEAEILAMTRHQLTVISPAVTLQRAECISESCKYSVRIGKKQIKLYNDSGIYNTTCVKMYEEYYMTLPGGLILPIALIVERQYMYETATFRVEEADWLVEAGTDYLENVMVGGQIILSDTTVTSDSQILCLVGSYDCVELIGESKNEEILGNYGYDY